MHTQTYINNNLLWTILDIWSKEIIAVLEYTKRNLLYMEERNRVFNAVLCYAGYIREDLKKIQVSNVEIPLCYERNRFSIRLDNVWNIDKAANCNMSFWKLFFQICYRKGNTLYFYKVK